MDGWANYETWNFMEWHRDQIDAYAEDFAAVFVEISTKEIADDIYEQAWEALGLNEMPFGFARDAASNAFHDIDFLQIANRVQAIAQAHLEKMED